MARHRISPLTRRPHPTASWLTSSHIVPSASSVGLMMSEETIIALKNYDYLVRSKGLDDVALAWESDTLVWGDGGSDIETLTEPGFTPATR